MHLLRSTARFALMLVCLLAPIAVWAQAWPQRPVKIVVPSPPGDGSDAVARAIADKLAIALGQPFVVENKPGAGGVIGSSEAAHAPHDGYTLIMGNAGSHGINAAVYSKLPYDIQKDFAPVSQVAVAPNVMVINPSVPANSVSEFIAYAKANPGKLSYASGGNGSSAHMSMELFKSVSGIDIQHVPYKGSSPALTDVVSGQVVAFIGNMPPTVPLIKAGKLKALAVTTKSRSTLMPELPTISEAGLPGFETVAWFGVLAPAGTPPEIVNRLSAEIAKIVKSPEMREKLVAMGAEPVGGTPDEFRAVIDRDIAKWKPLAQKVGIKVD